MTQTDERQDAREIVAPDENVPALASNNSFIDSAKEKVELDLEDAPFLKEESEEKKVVKDDKAEQEKQKEQEELERLEKAKKKKKLIILGIAGFLLIAVLGAGAYFFLASSGEEVIPPSIIIVPGVPEEELSGNLEVKLDPFWIELVNDKGKKEFLVGSFILHLSNLQGKDEVIINMKVVRDAIYYYFVNSDYEFLSEHQNIEQIKQGMIDLINQYVIHGEVSNIYFDSFLFR